MIQLKSVVKTYAPQGKLILDQVSFDVKKGEFLYILGGTGAGKTTLLKLLSLHESVTQGDLNLFGYSVAKASESTKQAIRRVMGYVPQTPHLIKDFSVFENVALSMNYGKTTRALKEQRLWIFEVLEKLGLVPYRDKRVEDLSGGEAQRVAIAQALSRKPELLICDEPTGSQDHSYSWTVLDLFVRLQVQGTTVMLATHDREMIRRVRKRCAVLRQGRVYFEEGQPSCTL